MNPTSFLSPDDVTFDRDVLERDGTVLVDFWAPWCGPCRGLKPVVERVGTERARGDFQVAFVNVDETPGLAQRYDIRSIPALKLFRDGRLVGELQGAHTKQELEDWLDANAA